MSKDTFSPSSIILTSIAFASSIMTSFYIVAFRSRAKETVAGISSLVGPVSGEDLSKNHVLHVCTKCSTANRRVKTLEEAPQVPRDKTLKPQTGQQMLERITKALALRSPSTHNNNDASQAGGFQKWQQINALAFKHSQTGNILRISPTQCFSACQQANCIAFSNSCKYSYHFGLLDHESLEDIEDIVGFADNYCAAEGEYKTKAGERPKRLGKENTISRVPPLMGVNNLNGLD
jgi:predicted metal-binding protein